MQTFSLTIRIAWILIVSFVLAHIQMKFGICIHIRIDSSQRIFQFQFRNRMKCSLRGNSYDALKLISMKSL